MAINLKSLIENLPFFRKNHRTEMTSGVQNGKNHRTEMTSGVQNGMVVSPLSKYPLRAYEEIYGSQNVCPVEAMDPQTAISDNSIRFVCISDTHTKIETLKIPNGDVLLHAGDFTVHGHPEKVDSFNQHLGHLPHPVKIVIAGNHDITFDNNKKTSRHVLTYLSTRNLKSVKELLTNCVYLEDSSVELCGIKIYGSPWVPRFCCMGFNVDRGQPLLDKWNKIPEDTDILITHTPPLGRQDLSISGFRAGCVDLLNTVQQRVKPQFHLFGHIHEGYGLTSDGHTLFINAANCDVHYKCVNPPIVFDFPVPDGHSRSELKLLKTKNIH